MKFHNAHPCFLPQRRSSRHSGSVLVVTLICLLIVMTMLGSMLQGSLRARRQLRTQRDLVQTELLLEAGANRAEWLILNDPEYRGETWRLPPESVLGTSEAQVTIQVNRESDENLWQVHVVAEYPFGSELSNRRSRTFLVPPNSILMQE